MGGCFVYVHRRIIELRRKYSEPGRCLHIILNKSRYLYTFLVAGGIAMICYPHGIGRFMAETSNQQINHLFTNHPLQCQEPWSEGNLLLDLFVFTLIKFFLVALASSLPIPAGVFVPVFVLGAVRTTLTRIVVVVWVFCFVFGGGWVVPRGDSWQYTASSRYGR